MKKLLLLIILFSALKSYSQNYTSPGIPSGTSSFTPTFRTKAATPDSLAQIWLAIGGNKFYRMLSGMDVIVFDARVVQGLGTTSSKLTFRDTLLKSNWVINPADTLHPVLTLIQKKSQDNLWLKGTGITDGRATIRFTTEKDTGDYEYGFLAGGDNNLYGLRNVRAAIPPNISWVWSVNAHNSDYTNFYRHVGMTGLTDTSTAAKILAIDANGKLFKVPYSSGGGTTPNPFTAATSGGASPGTTFDGSVARTFDYSSFGAQQALTLTTTGTSGVATLVGGALNIPNYAGTTYTATGGVVLSGTSFRLGSGTLQGSTVAISSPITTNFTIGSNSSGNTSVLQLFNNVLQLTSHKSSNGTSFAQFINSGTDAQAKIGYQNASATKEKSLTYGVDNKGIYHIDNVDTIGDRYADTSYAANGKRYDTWIPTWKAVKSRIDSAVSASGGTVHTSNGLSGDGSVGTPVVLGGTISGNIDEDIGANSIDWHGDNGTYAVDNLIDNTPGGSLISSQASNSAGSHYAAVNIGITSPTGWYAELATNKSGSGASIQLDGNTGNTTITNTLGSFGAQYGADYSTALRLNPNGIASVKVVKDMADSVKGTISAGASPGNPSGLLTFTASNGSNATYLRNDGLHAIDSTVVRSVANSYSLSGMQTKLNNYALTSALPVGANPTATAGSSVVNGSATTFMRSDAAPKVDSAVFRTVANSYSLSGLQTKFNGYVPTSTTVAGFPLSSNVTLAALTATDATLTFSGSYTGATARTVGLNLGNANTWTAAPTVSLAGITTSITTDGILVTNPTLATSSVAIQNPPVIRMTGHAWNATATAADNQGDYIMGVNMDRSNPSFPDPQWFLSARLSAAGSGAYTRFLTYDFYNGLTVTQALSVTGGVSTGNGITNSSGTIRSANFSAASAGNTMFIGNGNNFSASGTGMDLGGSTITNSSGTFNAAVIHPTYNQTSTAAATDLVVNRIETGVGSGTQRYASFQTSGTENLGITNKGELILREGSNGFAGQTTLVSGTKAITITGVTTGSRAFISFVSIGGTVTTTWQYAGVCTANTLTITALTNAGTTDTSDTSTVNYEIIN